MFERFTDRARKVMSLANQEAQRFNHEYIGTEHFLLGLVKEGSGVGVNALRNLDVDPDKVRIEVEKLVRPGPEPGVTGKLPQTPRSKNVVAYAIEEARSLNHNYVGTEHLLLGLLREQDGVAAQILLNLNLSLRVLREEVRNVLGAAQADAGSAPGREGLGNLDTTADGKPVSEFYSDDSAARLLQALRVELEARKDRAVIDGRYVEAACFRDLLDELRLFQRGLESLLARESKRDGDS